MENQHRKIAGYRELSQEEIDFMNRSRTTARCWAIWSRNCRAKPGEVDQRWVSIGATDLQTGLMALTRAVAKPTFF